MSRVGSAGQPDWYQVGPSNYTSGYADLSPTAFIAVDRTSPGGRRWEGENSLAIQFLGNDQGFADHLAANWSEQEVLGRSESYLSYSHTANRTIPISLIFQVTDDDPTSDSSPAGVRAKVNWLQALTMPTYDGQSIMYPPPACLLSFGDLYPVVRGIVRSVATNWQSPIDTDSMEMHHVGVDLDFVCANTGPLTAGDVLNNRFMPSEG